jgi:hypothetical protein
MYSEAFIAELYCVYRMTISPSFPVCPAEKPSSHPHVPSLRTAAASASISLDLTSLPRAASGPGSLDRFLDNFSRRSLRKYFRLGFLDLPDDVLYLISCPQYLHTIFPAKDGILDILRGSDLLSVHHLPHFQASTSTSPFIENSLLGEDLLAWTVMRALIWRDLLSSSLLVFFFFTRYQVPSCFSTYSCLLLWYKGWRSIPLLWPSFVSAHTVSVSQLRENRSHCVFTRVRTCLLTRGMLAPISRWSKNVEANWLPDGNPVVLVLKDAGI